MATDMRPLRGESLFPLRWLAGGVGVKSILIAFLCVFMAGASFAGRPNVIIIMTDDQGYGDIRSHGNPVLKTPEIDKLRESSVRFTDFHVAPMCSPTRGQLMTGMDAMRNGATAVCRGRSMMRNELKIMPPSAAREWATRKDHEE